MAIERVHRGTDTPAKKPVEIVHRAPSPYCSLYITRRQMEAVRAGLRGEKVKKRDAEAALRWVEEALR